MSNFKISSFLTLQGFSLIEMSLVLAIMGTVAGLSMPLLLEQKSLQKQQRSAQNIEMVLTALGTYAANRHSLPCPASKTSQGEPIACTKESTTAAVGYVPYKALGLQEKSNQDGFGHPLRYALDPTLSEQEHFIENTDPKLFITNENGRNVISTNTQNDRLAVVIISEGVAYQQPTSTFEMTNTNSTLTFVDAPFSSQKSNPFRHRVNWSTRNNLLTYYGKSAPIKPMAQETPVLNERTESPVINRETVAIATPILSAREQRAAEGRERYARTGEDAGF